MKFGFVILNFMVLDDVFNAYESIKNSLNKPEDYHIYIVDNGSSKEIQNDLKKKFLDADHTKLILLDKNIGFAQGNNIGIKRAKSDNCDFVICMNNDIIIEKCIELIKSALSVYNSDSNIAVIGPDIIAKNGHHQNPYKEEEFNATEKKWAIKTYSTCLGWMKYWLQMYWIPFFKLLVKSSRPPTASPNYAGKSRYVYALHGSFLIFTPCFFSYFEGFDPETFLYGEEIILAEKVYQQQLKCWYCRDVRVFHKEDVSTDIMLKGMSKKKFFLRHQYTSYQHLANTYFKNLLL